MLHIPLFIYLFIHVRKMRRDTPKSKVSLLFHAFHCSSLVDDFNKKVKIK